AFTYDHPDGKGTTKQGTYALMADGSVRWIPAKIDPKVLRALATRAASDNGDLADIDKTAPKIEEPKAPPPEEKKPEEKKPEEKKPDDKKDPGAKLETAPAPRAK